jgi:hypothetical protein
VPQVRAVWSSLNVSLGLTRPLFGTWQDIPKRFFDMLYDALSDVVPIKSNEFSVVASTQLNEVRARYSIYGGRSAVSITSDAVVFDFPSLVPTDAPLVQQIFARVHDALPKAFPEVNYETVNVQSFEHLAFTDQSDDPNDYLARFTFPNSDKFLGEGVVFRPAGKCEIVAQDQTWQCTLAVERSLYNARAVFVAITFAMKKMGLSSSYAEKVERAEKIVRFCHQLLDLKQINATR